MRRYGLILGILALILVLAAGAYVWVQRTNYVAAKLAFVTDPLDLPVGPTAPSDAARAGNPRILIVGDSRVGRWGPPPAMDGAVFFLRGAGGETSAGAVRRIAQELALFKPDVVLVMTGINDLVAASLNPASADTIEDGLVANIFDMAEAARRSGAVPVVATVVQPAEPDLLRKALVWSDAIWPALLKANRAILRRAGEREIRVIDLATTFGADAGPLDGAFAKDTLHWNDRMYERLNTLLAQALAGL